MFSKDKIKKLLIVFSAILALAVGVFLIERNNLKQAQYASEYSFVSEKISKSANIRINLPKGVDPEIAKSNITFDPEIKGTFLEEKVSFFNVFASEENDYLIFKPDNELELNRNYSVKLDLGDNKSMQAFFLAVENPEIINILPIEGTEASEDSKISIVFNRPIVPLTTLDYLETQKLPIEISPYTQGRFKWISTNTLQFTPEERLQLSSNYTVKINPGFTSMDGLSIEPEEAHFTSKNLRYLNYDTNNINNLIYNQPIRLYFNQEVDLDKTIKEIQLFLGDKQIDFIAKYKGDDKKGITSLFSSLFDSSEKEEIDRSVIEIYNKSDKFNRQGFWDFNESYKLAIKKVYPNEGDININDERQINFTVSSIIKSWGAESDRTSYASPDLFDKEGKLLIDFYEDINISKSNIEFSKQTESIIYGEKCSDENLSLHDYNCNKVEDNSKVIIKFQSDKISAGDIIKVTLNEIINKDGLKINPEKIEQDILVYKPLDFKITETKLTNFLICSNNPILAPEASDFKNYIKTDLDYEIFSWNKSYQTIYGDCYKNLSLPYQTYVYVGLMPGTNYDFDFELEDVFAQKQSLNKSFLTGEMSSINKDIYQMQQLYSITSPNETKLSFGAKNINYVDVSICKMNGPGMIENLYTSHYSTYSKFNANYCTQNETKRINLPEKYWITKYFDVDIKDFYSDPIGNYAITISSPEYDYDYEPITFLTVTNMAVGEKRITPNSYYNYDMTEEQLSNLKNLYLVSDINNGDAVSNAEIYYYKEDGTSKKVGETDGDGVVLASPIYGLKGIYVKKGNDITIIKSSESRLEYASSAYNVKKIYIYEDKPIYRPGEKVNINAILRLGYDGNYEMFEDEEVNITVRNSKWDIVFEGKSKLSIFGTTSANFLLASDAALGNYSVCIKDICSYFDVQEYVPSAFEVKLSKEKEEYVSKENISMNIDANYYFGVPVENAEVEYVITTQNYYFDKYTKEYFKWDSQDYGYYYGYDYGDKFILRGKTTLDENGKGKVQENIDFEKIFEGNNNISKIFVVDVTVKNSMGQSVSSQNSFIMHRGDFYLGIKTDPSFVSKNQDFSLKVKSVNTEGNDLKVNNIDAQVNKIEWVYSKRKDVSGSYSYKWEKKSEFVQEFKFNTNNSGDYEKTLKFDNEGIYEIIISSSDSKGNVVKSAKNIYVYGNGYVGFRYTDNTDLELVSEKTDLNAGDKGEIIIESPFKEAKALISIERGEIFDYQIIDISGSLYNYTFDIKEEYYPNVFVSVLLQSKEGPAVKFGSKEFKVNSDVKKINLDFKSDKESYEPGEEVKINIVATDYNNKPVSSTISLSVVDLSVLALKGNPKKDPLVFFYNGFPLTVSTSSNLKNIIEIKDTRELTKGGGGGENESKEGVRGEFRDIAFFKADIVTDENGKAEISFKLPDNLTTWQAEALGVTKDTKLGVNYITFVSKKDLMIVPLKPRFIIPGDEFYIGSQVFNQSDRSRNFKVEIKSDTLELLDKDNQNVFVESKDSANVYFKVKAPLNVDKGYHSFEISVKDGDLSDAVMQAIKINSNLTYEATATAGYTTGASAFETIYLPENISSEKGELTINSSATLAVFMSDALNYLIQYPYGCAEQISSRLKAMAIIKSGLNIPNLSDKFNLEKVVYNNREYSLDELMQIGLSKIYSYQNYDGGYSFWGNSNSSYYLTISIVDALNHIKQAGYAVNENAITKGADYLYKEYNRKSAYQSSNDAIMLINILRNIDKYKEDAIFKSKIESITSSDSILKDELNNQALANLAVIVNSADYSTFIKDRVNNFLDNRINIDARGAFLETASSYSYYYFETAIANTADYLKSIALAKRDTSFNDKVVRWLLNSRKKDGTWGSTQNNLKVIDAFTNYLKWKKETNANYKLVIDLNNEEIESHDFNSETILDQVKKVIPISEFEKGEFNLLQFQKDDKDLLSGSSLYYDLGLKYYLEGGNIAPRDEGFSITKGFYNLDDKENKNPLTTVQVGDVFKAHIEIIVPATRRFVAIEDYIPAGMEIINMDFATEQKALKYTEKEINNRLIYPDFKEIRDDRYFIYEEYMNPGVYEFDYYVRALVKGDYLNLPSVASEMYNPEVFGRTNSSQFKVK